MSSTETPVQDKGSDNFLETALRLSGKSEEETRTTGAIDRADEAVEALFEERHRTSGSPIHRAVWDREFPLELFFSTKREPAADTRRVMEESIALARRHHAAGTMHDERGKIRESVFEELGDVGYWSLLVPREFGGQGTPPTAFFPFLTRMAMVDATLAGLASIHGCVGAVDPLKSFGSPEQKDRYLPRLAKGRPLSGFALTEPNAGSDMTALRTRAVLDGDSYILDGEKLFITNASPGRAICVVCLIDNVPQILLVDLPAEENENFQFVRYGLYALKQGHNLGLKFHRFRVPKENLIQSPYGNGLMMAYRGLNNGRVALCAFAAGVMRVMLASMIPWAKYRRTYGDVIARRELVRRRMGELAGLIVGCDALVAWCSWLLEEGYRGEMECIIAKVFGSESQKHAAIEYHMKTHGGRAFLHGHMFGDNLHEFLAPCIYEGEGEMLGMAFFKALAKEHGKQFFEPIGKKLHDLGIRKPNLSSPSHLWALKGPMWKYAKWRGVEMVSSGRGWIQLPSWIPGRLANHAHAAIAGLQRSRIDISAAMTKYQLGLADRQCLVSQLSSRVRDYVTILTTSLWAAEQEGEITRMAADVLCSNMLQKLEGHPPSDGYFRKVTKLGEAIIESGQDFLGEASAPEILMGYNQ